MPPSPNEKLQIRRAEKQNESKKPEESKIHEIFHRLDPQKLRMRRSTKLTIADVDVNKPVVYRSDITSQPVMCLPQKVIESQFKTKGNLSIFRMRSSDTVEHKFKELKMTYNTEVLRQPEPHQIPRLAHDLEEVLVHPGVHIVHENTPSFLKSIYQPHEIDYNAIPPFVTTSKDPQMHELANKHSIRYCGSTSSLTSIMIPLYFIVSNHKPTNANRMRAFAHATPLFTPAIRKPQTIALRPIDKGIYAIDSYKLPVQSNNQILLDLGKSMEKMLCTNAEEFKRRFLKKNNGKIRNYVHEQEVYRYSKLSNFLIRSQLDCQSPVLEGDSKVFDIKTRATFPIRINIENYEDHSHIMIDAITGERNSYEREFYDMVRSVFIKYSYQARMGDMNGMFIAYHNTKKICGFEYITAKEIDHYVFGSSYMASKFYYITMALLEKTCDLLTSHFPNVPLKCTFWANRVAPYALDIYVEPIPNDKGWDENGDMALVTPENPLGLGREVYRYTMKTKVYKNGELVTNFLHFTERDDIKVEYSLARTSSYEENEYLFHEYESVMQVAAQMLYSNVQVDKFNTE